MRYVLLPGLHGTSRLFAPFTEAAPSGSGFELIDYPEDGPQSVSRLADVVSGRLSTDPYILVAESFGGPIALAAAAKHPPGLVGLVLAGSFARSPVPAALAHLPDAAFRLAMTSLYPARVALAGPGRSRRLDELLRAELPRVPPTTFLRRVRTILTTDVQRLLGGVRVPSLILRATRDLLVPRRCHRELVAGLLAATSIAIEGPHMLLEERPRACWEAIVSWQHRQDSSVPIRNPSVD